MFLRRITHRSPCTAAARRKRGSNGRFKPTAITTHPCQTARDCVLIASLLAVASGLAFAFSFDRRSPQGLVLRGFAWTF